jgi:hypothetical protein
MVLFERWPVNMTIEFVRVWTGSKFDSWAIEEEDEAVTWTMGT